MVLTAAAIYALAIAAGFSGQGAVNATAVALAESGGDTGILSTTGDRGLWQLNNRWHAEVSDTCAYDPACAVREVYRISGGGSDWSQWATWKNGRAQRYMSQAQAAASGGGDGVLTGSSAGAAGGTLPRAAVVAAVVLVVGWALG